EVRLTVLFSEEPVGQPVHVFHSDTGEHFFGVAGAVVLGEQAQTRPQGVGQGGGEGGQQDVATCSGQTVGRVDGDHGLSCSGAATDPGRPVVGGFHHRTLDRVEVDPPQVEGVFQGCQQLVGALHQQDPVGT